MVATSATERDGLANEAYTGGAYLEQQRQSVLLSTWQFAGRVSQLQNVGDVVSTKVASSPVLLLRDEKSVIRAFDNVCPHRGTRLIGEPCTGLNSIVCPYHGWSFCLDGSLIGRHIFMELANTTMLLTRKRVQACGRCTPKSASTGCLSI